MKIVPWKRKEDDFLLKPLADFRREMDRLFDRFFEAPSLDFETSFSPNIEVSENEKNYVVKAELPGLDDKDVEVSLDDNVLTIKGEKKEEKEDRKKNAYYREISYGSFYREIPFQHEIDEDKVEAKFKKGVLKITLPKKHSTQSKSIKIESEE